MNSAASTTPASCVPKNAAAAAEKKAEEEERHAPNATATTRRVLVVEFWEGCERACGHRCERASGPCRVRPLRAMVEESLGEMSAEDRAAAERFLRGRTVL